MKIEGGSKYHVKLIPSHCHREEVVFEIISALDHLTTVSNEIFTCLRTRVAEQNAKLSSINTRVSTVAEKVQQYMSSPKAIQILSPAKFPEAADPAALQFPVLQLKCLGEQAQITDSEEIMSRIKSQRGLHESPVKHTDELLQYYRVRDFNYSKDSSLGQLGTQYELGLGNPPRELNVVDSFFLFNSVENPYHKYTVTERAGALASNRSVRNAEQGGANGKPESESRAEDKTNQSFENQPVDDFYYYPSSVQIPTIDVPDHLPDLVGLSDTFDFETIDAPVSVFSFQRQASVSFPPSPIFPTSTQAQATVIKAEKMAVTSATPPTAVIAPPPPPPLPGLISTSITPNPSSNVPPALVVATSTPPPPAPPLPPAEHVLPKPTPENATVPRAAPMGHGSPDLRSTLMSAIREAGGKSKLKSRKNARSEPRADSRKNQQEEKPEAGTGCDLMADLKNSLAMRRRGISGMNGSRRQPGLGDIMQKMASTIPLNEDSIDSSRDGISDEDDVWD